MRLLHKDRNTESVGHDGVEYERDEHGAFELPHELAESLLERFPHVWEIAPEPVPAEPAKPRRAAKAKPEPEPETVVEDEDPQDEDQADEPAVHVADDTAPKPRGRKTTAAAQ